MKHISIAFIVVLILFSGCRTKKVLSENQTDMKETEPGMTMTDFHDPTTWLLGYFTRDRLNKAPHCEWYLKGYDEYKPDSLVVNKLTLISKENLTVKIVMGTWCPDSRREVPRLMRILDYWKFPMVNVTFIGVDDSKLSPVGEYSKLDIQRVPTFIFYKNNIEAGRIIEVPVTSLEQDMVNILTRE
jgi:thiol-disulfide isomerase/thioredoxin